MSQTAALPTFGTIYAFGDSLSDAGNLSIFTILTGTEPVSPPYFQEKYGSISGNVFSNGPTWVQDLSIALGLGTLKPSLTGGGDFAYGGAQTGATPQNGNDPTIQAISLPSQFGQFQALVAHPSANALYTLSIGGNDLFAILGDTGLSAPQQTADVNAAVANAVAFVKQLVGDGAKNLLVLDVPDLGKVPEVTTGLVNGTNTPSAALDAEASQLSAEYNTGLASQLGSLASADGLNVYMVDAYQLIDNAFADPSVYGLTNVTAPVWSGNYTSSSSGTLAVSGAAAQDQYLFWDHVHPTETGQQLLADAAAVDLSGSSSRAEITRLYNNILQRAPDPAGLLYWDAKVDSSAVTFGEVNAAFATSVEAETYVVPIVELYTVFGRAPDAAGLQYWVQAYTGGDSLNGITASFLASTEGQGIYGTSIGGSPAANLTFLNTVYENVLGRTPDTAGEQYWAGLLNAGTFTPAQVLTAIVGSPEAQARDATPVTNFLIAAGNGTADYSGDLFAGSSPVVAAAASVADASVTGGSTVDLGTAPAQTVNLGVHVTGITLVVGTDQDAVYGSGDVVTVNGFTIGTTPGTSDMLAFLAGGAAPVSVTGVSGTFGGDGTGQSGLTATASSGILTFAGAAAGGDTLAQLLAAAANILDTPAFPANSAAAFQFNGSTYLVATPSAPGAGGSFGLASDHVFDLNGVTGVTALGTTAAAHVILV
jgi:phospholipase/lecithinase/hemolysin